MLDHTFGAGDPYTLGVEEEFMLLDPETWDLVQHIEAVLAKAAEGEYAERVHSELMQSVVEITTPVCRSAAEAGAQLRRLRAHVAEVARTEGVPLRVRRDAPLQPVRAPADHGEGPLPRGSSSRCSTSPAAS